MCFCHSNIQCNLTAWNKSDIFSCEFNFRMQVSSKISLQNVNCGSTRPKQPTSHCQLHQPTWPRELNTVGWSWMIALSIALAWLISEWRFVAKFATAFAFESWSCSWMMKSLLNILIFFFQAKRWRWSCLMVQKKFSVGESNSESDGMYISVQISWTHVLYCIQKLLKPPL